MEGGGRIKLHLRKSLMDLVSNHQKGRKEARLPELLHCPDPQNEMDYHGSSDNSVRRPN